MKVVNLLDGADVEAESILAVYTGSLEGLNTDTPLEPEVFETSVHDRIMTQDLVLHEKIHDQTPGAILNGSMMMKAIFFQQCYTKARFYI